MRRDDADLFAPRWHDALRTAASELSWLLSRGYNERSALKLVGDRHGLDRRQRTAVSRCSCADAALEDRLGRRLAALPPGRAVGIDGLNVLITVECALAGGLVLVGRDGCSRDLEGVHGAYRTRERGRRAIRALARWLVRADAVTWYLDRPVSNTGKLRQLLEGEARRAGARWRVELVSDPDAVLGARGELVVATSDSAILDRCGDWIDLVGPAIAQEAPDAWILDLGRDIQG